MPDALRVAVAGIGGYGGGYVHHVLDHPGDGGGLRLAAVVDKEPERFAGLRDLQKRGIAVHASLDDLYAGTAVDLLIVSTPIHRHRAHTCARAAPTPARSRDRLGAVFERPEQRGDEHHADRHDRERRHRGLDPEALRGGLPHPDRQRLGAERA